MLGHMASQILNMHDLLSVSLEPNFKPIAMLPQNFKKTASIHV